MGVTGPARNAPAYERGFAVTVDPNVFETANAGFAQALYEEFLKNPTGVTPEWRTLFESGVIGERPAPSPTPEAAALRGSPNGAVGEASPGGTIPLTGPAARLAANMAESLSVPTATTFRTLAVTRLEQERTALNTALKTAGRPEKLSFTHLIAFALTRAAARHPVMGTAFTLLAGEPHRREPAGVQLGLAVDITRKDGSRGLVVPVLRNAEQLDFGGFLAAYDLLVDKARHNRLMPDDFAGATITLTNPGGLGTVASVPRLMAGQGSIIAVGSIAYPAEYRDVPDARRAELGLSKVMTITSTYDHRVIQGAESGEFLRTLDGFLQGDEGFYDEVRRGLALSPAVTLAAGPGPGAAGATGGPATPEIPASLAELEHVAAAMSLVKAIRTHGHLAAHLDPLGTPPIGDPALDPATLALTPDVMQRIPAAILRVAVPGSMLTEILPALWKTYCGTIAYEIEHVSNHEERVWLRETIESGTHCVELTREEKLALLDRLIAVEAFERFLHKAYLGQKRFSIEGLDALVPMLDLTVESAAANGAHEVVIGMAHRGRLNVLAHIIGRPYVSIFAEFEGHHAQEGVDEEVGTGDVKYHHGAEGAYPTATGRAITVTLAHNPSHLEFVGPVVDGRARAEQTQRRGQTAYHNPSHALPVIIHGDAAFAGQGVVAETLNLGGLDGYRTGGTLHLITNNQIGFTTDARDARSTMHASDLAKGFDIPIVHVNADDPEACLAAVRLALMYRERFHQDVLIDLVGYRRHGHNEGDEPAYTQPVEAARIRAHPSARELYGQALTAEGIVTADEVNARAEAAYQRLVEIQQGTRGATPKTSTPEVRVKAPVVTEIDTGVEDERLRQLNEQLLARPEGFATHPKLQKQLERRREALDAIDWGHAESLALASLLAEGVPIRMTGQDTERGTFSHRHLVLHDAKTGARFAPIQHLPGALAPIELHNSPLSELATLGFEYGYSAAAPDVLVLWEAQFGDFINGAQVIVDQFLVSGLSKWGLTTRLTLLLPHGYEGQGPEHSSARLERFLQLAAENNIRVANCTTPAQYFHLLRRQALHNRQRPLILLTPKSLLRHPAATSPLADLTTGRFQPVLDDPRTAGPGGGGRETITRLVLCSGKVYYDLLHEAERMETGRPAIARLEQLYSFPEEALAALVRGYPALTELVWAQEEPRNMGAWPYLCRRLDDVVPHGVKVQYAGRPERASPAEGYPGDHQREQARLVAEALGVARHA